MMKRCCVRCGKELTDAASLEVGIGPVCRQLANKLLALAIPADVELAKSLYFQAAQQREDFPKEVLGVCATIAEELLHGIGADGDWRKTVKRIEWVLSFDLPAEAAALLIGVVEALGYVSVASFLRGVSSSGTAEVWFAEGRLFVAGPNNKGGREAIKALVGRSYHAECLTPSEDVRPGWSVPAKHVAAFKTLVLKFWPFSKGLEEAVAAAQTYVAATPKVETGSGQKEVWVVMEGNQLVVKTPYNAGFIAALKSTVPWKNRQWNPGKKVWVCDGGYQEVVTHLVLEYFPQ